MLPRRKQNINPIQKNNFPSGSSNSGRRGGCSKCQEARRRFLEAQQQRKQSN